MALHDFGEGELNRHVVCPESSKFVGICVTFCASLGPHVPHMNYHESRWSSKTGDMNLANPGESPPFWGTSIRID